jgi:hypothetical protein
VNISTQRWCKDKTKRFKEKKEKFIVDGKSLNGQEITNLNIKLD